MNERLAHSASPYLRAHADNPVDWYPWGADAFAQAEARDVPVMISIGYSTCHWCHVMARESFQDADTAQQMNREVVAVKVDREEHPEVDDVYMAAASAFTRNLGWPLTVFATPDGRAFFAGTYFPKAASHGMPSFRQVLDAVHEAWTSRRRDALQAADTVAAALARRDADVSAALPTRDDLAAAAAAVLAREDHEYGGFAPPHASLSTPKFPSVPALRFLQSPLGGPAQTAAADMARRSLAAMAASPLHDAVDGGFFRYATRRDWTVPHYERMLTDNAGLLQVAVDAGDTATARDVARFLTGVLQRNSGGFAAAQDSESWIDGVRSEGGYYTRNATDRVAVEPPAVDGKIVTGWNGLAVGALSAAGARWGDDTVVAVARHAADAVLAANAIADGLLRRASLDGTASPAAATLEDYGLLADGLLRLACVTGDAGYAVRARQFVDTCLSAGVPAVPGGGDAVLAAHGLHAPATAADADHPSGPAALAGAALRLWVMGAGDRYRQAAASIVQTYAAEALAEPLAHGALLRVAVGLAVPPRQLVVVGGGHDRLTDAARVRSADVFAVVSEQQARAFADAGFALFEERSRRDVTGPDGHTEPAPTAYDCRDFACRLPVTGPEELSEPEVPAAASS